MTQRYHYVSDQKRVIYPGARYKQRNRLIVWSQIFKSNCWGLELLTKYHILVAGHRNHNQSGNTFWEHLLGNVTIYDFIVIKNEMKWRHHMSASIAHIMSSKVIRPTVHFVRYMYMSDKSMWLKILSGMMNRTNYLLMSSIPLNH